jgi:hypothetical protein
MIVILAFIPNATEICNGIDDNCDGLIDRTSAIATLTGNSIFCEGAILTLSANGGHNFTWTGPNGFTDLVATITIDSVSMADSGTYVVTIIDSTCSDTTLLSLQVFVVAPPVAIINGLKSVLLCWRKCKHINRYSFRWHF